ncbi:MAG: hypothetical protein WCA21_01860 [Terracidiphilus sp.]|jgi:hypothetical protein
MANPSRKPVQQRALKSNEVPITNPNSVIAVYSNHFGISATMTDFTIHFLELGQVPGPNGPIHKQEVKAIVTLPLIAAAGMIQVLQQLMLTQANQFEEMKKLMASGKE